MVDARAAAPAGPQALLPGGCVQRYRQPGNEHRPLWDHNSAKPACAGGHECGARSPAGAGLLAHRLFCRCSLFDRRFFDGLFALSIGIVQEPIDEASTALLLDPSLLRFLLVGEEPVIYFPAHCVLHQQPNQRRGNTRNIAYNFEFLQIGANCRGDARAMRPPPQKTGRRVRFAKCSKFSRGSKRPRRAPVSAVKDDDIEQIRGGIATIPLLPQRAAQIREQRIVQVDRFALCEQSGLAVSGAPVHMCGAASRAPSLPARA